MQMVAVVDLDCFDAQTSARASETPLTTVSATAATNATANRRRARSATHTTSNDHPQLEHSIARLRPSGPMPRRMAAKPARRRSLLGEPTTPDAGDQCTLREDSDHRNEDLAPRISERALIMIAGLAAVVHGFDELVVRPDFHEPRAARVVAAMILLGAFVALLIAAVRPPTQRRQTLVAAAGAAAFSAGIFGMLHEAGHRQDGGRSSGRRAGAGLADPRPASPPVPLGGVHAFQRHRHRQDPGPRLAQAALPRLLTI